MEALGVEVLLAGQVEGKPGMVSGRDIEFAQKDAREFAQRNNGFYVDQFNNFSNLKAHFVTTGPEIWADLSEIEAFVATVGSGGVLIGNSRFLKAKNSHVRCIAVEPAEAAILKTGREKTQNILFKEPDIV